MSIFTNTQLTEASGYNPNNMVFTSPSSEQIKDKDGKVSISYKRINIGTKNPDGTKGELVIQTPDVFSFGVKRNTLDSSRVSYTLPLALWNKDGVTTQEKEFTDVFSAICDNCKDHILENKDEIEKYDLESSDLKKFNPLWWKRDKGKIVDGSGPVLYVKLNTDRDGNVTSSMYDSATGDDITPLTLENKYCYVTAALKIESIFIGNKVSLQVKVYEAYMRPLNTGFKKLLRPPVEKKVNMTASSSVHSAFGGKNDEESSGSDSGSDGSINSDEDQKPESPPKVKKIVKKRIVKPR